MKITQFSPVVLFVFSRPKHTQRTVDALLKNPEACYTDLIVYSDAPRNEVDKKLVAQVRAIFDNLSGFKSIKLNIRSENYGLAKNIINGITDICREYDRFIVLEDDIVTSPSFLYFMNSALEKYKNESSVWHISGWNYPLKKNDDLPDSFFWRVMNCWGWATWSDRWKHFKKDPDELISMWSKDDIHRFNINGYYDFWSQVIANYRGCLDTWAIFWYATIFSNKGLCLNPTQTLVHNIGNDGSGENCGKRDIYKSSLIEKRDFQWPSNIGEDHQVLTQIQEFYKSIKPSIMRRVLNKVIGFIE